MKKILVLSPDTVLSQRYVKELVKSGFHVADAPDFLDGMFTASKTNFDVIIIDEELYSSGDYLEISKIRKHSSAHIVLLGKGTIDEVSAGGGGYDAYFPRSANPQELVTYIKSVVQHPEIKRETVALKKRVDIVAPSQAESIVDIVTDLEQQIVKIKTVMSGIGQMQSQIADAQDIVRQQQQALEIVLRKLAEVNRHLENFAGDNADKG